MENRPHRINLMSFLDEITSLVGKDNYMDATGLEFGVSQKATAHNVLVTEAF